MSLLTESTHRTLSTVTGVRTEHAESSIQYLATSVAALSEGQYRIAGVAALCSLSAGIMAGINFWTDKDVRTLNKLSPK
jgi:hypothetical protein